MAANNHPPPLVFGNGQGEGVANNHQVPAFSFGNNNNNHGAVVVSLSSRAGLLNANSQSFTDIPMMKFSHLWTIKHFNLIPVEMERLCSPQFSPPNTKDLWFLKLRLKAYDENNQNQEYIGVHLFLKEAQDKKKEVRAHYTISVLDAMGNKRFTGECSKPEGRIFKAGTEGHGYKLLCPREGIFRPENKLLGEDNSLNIRCEVTVFGEIKNTQHPPPFSSPFSDSEKKKASLGMNLGKFFSLDKMKDTVLKGRDGCKIWVHRSILMARSDVFFAMFDHEMKERKSNEVDLDDVDPDVLKAMVHYMYTDEVPKIKEIADELIVVADRFQVSGLKMTCEEWLMQHIDVQTVGHYLAVADMTNADHLKKECLKYTTENAFDVTSMPDWNKSVNKRPHLALEAFDLLAKKMKVEPRPESRQDKK